MKAFAGLSLRCSALSGDASGLFAASSAEASLLGNSEASDRHDFPCEICTLLDGETLMKKVTFDMTGGLQHHP